MAHGAGCRTNRRAGSSEKAREGPVAAPGGDNSANRHGDRLNRRKPPSSRPGASQRRRGEWLLRVWAEWAAGERERGWPAVSCEVRCLQAAQVGAVSGGQPAGPRIPPFDRARLGPQVHRALLDIAAHGPVGERCALVLRLCGGNPRVAHTVLAESCGLTYRTWRRAWDCGLLRLGGMV